MNFLLIILSEEGQSDSDSTPSLHGDNSRKNPIAREARLDRNLASRKRNLVTKKRALWSEGICDLNVD